MAGRRDLGGRPHAIREGTSLVAGSRARIDVRFSGRSSRGVVAAAGVEFAFMRLDGSTYIKAGRETLKHLGAPAPIQRVAAERWLRLAPDEVELTGISLRGDYKGRAAARFEFTDFDADFRITRPNHPLDAGSLRPPPPRPRARRPA